MSNGNIIGSFFDQDSANRIEILEDHIHKRAITFPQGVSPIQLSTTNSAWSDFSNMIAEILSAGGVSSIFAGLGDTFDIHWAIISAISADDDYELKLYKGAAGSEVEIAHIPFTRNAVLSQEGAIPVQTPLMNTNERISGAIQSGGAAVRTAQVKLIGHVY
jgi:hypothetical protein